MCYGNIDPRILALETEDRCVSVKMATDAAPERSAGGVPPELMSGWRGVWARFAARMPRIGSARKPLHRRPI